METGPSEVILTLNCDLNVDFDEPYDYKEVTAKRKKKKEDDERKRQEEQMRTMRNEKINQHKQTGGFVPFSGKGHVLGSK